MQGFKACIRVKSKMSRFAGFWIGFTVCIISGLFISVLPAPAVAANGSPLLAPAVPANPSQLNVQTVSHVRIDLAWTDNSANEIGFKIERKTPGGTYAEIVTIGANVTVFIDSTLSANTEYYYRVRAYNASGFSGYTNEGSATTLPNPLAAPSNPTATPITQTKINLAWTDNSNIENGFKIERRLSTATAYTVIATVGANVTSRADSGLAANTKYFYRVRAFNANGNSAYAAAVSATTLPFPPAGPGNLTATVISNNQIDLAWADNSGDETGFKIERKIPQSGDIYAQIATVGANVTSFSSTVLNANTKYYYRVRANNAGGDSPYSNAVNAITFPNPPAAPGNLTATTSGQSQINLAWADNSGNETGFRIERKIPQGGSVYAEIATVGANLTSYSDTGLSAGTQYFYRIRAANAGGQSPYSNEANATTLQGAPAAPGNLAATTISSSQINIMWADNSGNEAGFKIERKTPQSGGTFAEIATAGANVTNFSSTGLNANTKYFYRVRAYNNGGHSAYSLAVDATTLPKAPAAPTNLTAAVLINLQIKIVWKDNAFNEDIFLIERRLGAAGAYTQIATAGPNVMSYTDAGLNPVTTYFYRVRASNLGGSSIYSNETNATTFGNPPPAPNNLTATVVSQTQINLAWNDNTGNENGFAVERKIAGGTFQQISTVGVNVKNYADTGLAPGTQYFYRVSAYNADGFSTYSNEAGGVTLPAPPAAASNLTATPVSNIRISLAWNDNSNSESGFKIERKTPQSGAETYAQMATVNANVQSFVDSSLVQITTWFYRVRAFNAGGHSAFTNEANATTLPDPPATPANLTTVTISRNQINLAWTDNSTTENGFRIERKTPQSGGTYSEIVTVAANVKNYSDVSLAQDTPYFYRVCAFNTGGHSSFSNESNSTTLPNPPAKPGGLTATAASNVKINLVWKDSSNNETGFKIERKKTATGTYAQIATAGANVKTFADSALLANMVYFYRVRAFNAGGHSNYCTETSTKTLPNPPAAPSSLTVTSVSISQISLTWTDNSANESGFRIERKIGATGIYTVIAAMNANAISYLDGGLSTASPYFYRVRAFNAGGNSNYSNEVKAVTLPRGPGGLTAATVSNTRLSLAWTDSSDNETGFKIERKISGGLYAEMASTTANVKMFTDSLGLSANTTYFYRVRAINNGGLSNYSNEANAKTLPNPPAAPDSLRATATSDTKIDLAWADRSFNEAGFKIERKIGAAGFYVQIAAVAANAKSFSDVGLAVNTNYFYRVRAFNAGGHSGYSNATNTVTLPVVPGSLRGEPLANHKIALVWTDSSSNESGFKLERRTNGGAYVEIAQVGANVNAHADSNLVANTEYFYRLRAFNAGGHSAYSNEANITTLPNPPAAPSGLMTTTISNRQLNLAWLDSSDNEIGFAIERKIPQSADVFEQVGTVAANVTVYADTTLVEKTQYFYRLFAFNTGGNSGYSIEASATTLPDPPAEPTSLTATVAGSSQINLTWLDNSDDEDGFSIERKIDSIYVEIAILGANVTSYADVGLTEDVTHYYRLLAFNIGGNSAYSDEVNATPSDDANFALNQSTLASSTEVSSATGRAVDGNLNTFWQSGVISSSASQAWLRAQLHASTPVIIDRVVVKWHQTYFAKEYDVQISDNGTSWTTVHTNNAGAIGTQNLSFTATSARYVRLYMRKNNKANYRVAEFEVYFGLAKTRNSAAKNELIIPTTLALAQNYPNPFSANGTFGNPSTTISYSLPQGMNVTLKVINITGQEVAKLADGYQDRGIYRVTFNARRLPSGVYYAILQAGEARLVRRMVLLK